MNRTENVMSLIDSQVPEIRNSARPAKERIIEAGSIVEIDGNRTAKKTPKRLKTSDLMRQELTEAVESYLYTTIFDSRIKGQSKEGLVIRMEKNDYTVKITSHTKRDPQYATAILDPNFVPEKSFETKGSVVNHSAAISKSITSGIENQKLKTINSEIKILNAKSSGIRVLIGEAEFTIKATKKTKRVEL